MAKNKHSIVAPSAASRWLACPPSALLAEKAGGDTGGVYADEGTLAHRLAELYLSDYLNKIKWKQQHPDQPYNHATCNPEGLAGVKEAQKDPLFYDGMFDEIRVYTDHVIGLLEKAGPGARMEVEARYPLFYKKDDSGTIDNLIYGGEDRTLYVTDLKFGKGVPVEARGNKQLLIYAIDAYDAVSAAGMEIDRVVMTIVQPRRNSLTSWALDVSDLQLEREVIEATAKKALKGEGRFKTGPHCKFCPVKPRCRALKDEAAGTAGGQFDDPALLTDAEIARLLGSIDTLADWIGSVKKYALQRAVDGIRFEGFKLVQGTSRRQITDERAILRALAAAGYEISLFKRSSLVTIGELERTLDKADFAALCAPHIVKTEAPPLLVPASDPRTEYGIAKAVEDFAEFRN